MRLNHEQIMFCDLFYHGSLGVGSVFLQISQVSSSDVKEVVRKTCNVVIIHFQTSDIRSLFEKIKWKRLEVIVIHKSGRMELAL